VALRRCPNRAAEELLLLVVVLERQAKVQVIVVGGRRGPAPPRGVRAAGGAWRRRRGRGRRDDGRRGRRAPVDVVHSIEHAGAPGGARLPRIDLVAEPGRNAPEPKEERLRSVSLAGERADERCRLTGVSLLIVGGAPASRGLLPRGWMRSRRVAPPPRRAGGEGLEGKGQGRPPSPPCSGARSHLVLGAEVASRHLHVLDHASLTV